MVVSESLPKILFDALPVVSFWQYMSCTVCKIIKIRGTTNERKSERANERKDAQRDVCTNERTMIMNEAKLSTYRLTPE